MTKPHIRILEPGDEAALEAFLQSRIESSMFLLGNMQRAGLADHGARLQGSYAAAFEGDQIVGVVTHYRQGNLLPQAPAHLNELIRAAVNASRRPVHGIVGPADQVFAIRDILALHGATFSLNNLENLYTLELTELKTPPLLASGAVTGRRAQARDLEMLTRWRVEYSVESLSEGETDDLWRQAEEWARRSIREGTTWVLETSGAENGGQPVAMTGFNTTVNTSAVSAVQIGGVYTPPRVRGRGYARAAVAQSLLDARAEGANRAILFTDDENVPAHRAYTSLGFEIVGEYALVLLNDCLTLDT